MFTEQELKENNFTVSSLQKAHYHIQSIFQATGPALESVTMMDILDSIPADTVIVKMDIESYECKVIIVQGIIMQKVKKTFYLLVFAHSFQTFQSVQALQPDILLGKSGKHIPYIFMEWEHLPNNKKNCPQYRDWVQLFYAGGYHPVRPGIMVGQNIENQ